MAQQPTHWPDDHDDRPAGVTIRPLHRLPDQFTEPTIATPPTIAGDQRGSSYGTPGASAMAYYQRSRAAEWATFLRTLPWRLAGVIAAGGLVGTLTHGAGPRVAGPAAAVAAGGLGWLLRFRVSRETAAWRRGARGERRTARRLRPLLRAGWTVLHDVAIPQSRANGDHLLIGPPGMFLVDSKAWHGRITLGADGSAWHNGHPMGGVLDTVRWEAEQLTQTIGAPVIPMLCVHDTQLPWGELYTQGIPLLTPAKLVATLRTLSAHLDQIGVMLLAEHARHLLHPAA